jgi:hypothetical protein
VLCVETLLCAAVGTATPQILLAALLCAVGEGASKTRHSSNEFVGTKLANSFVKVFWSLSYKYIPRSSADGRVVDGSQRCC